MKNKEESAPVTCNTYSHWLHRKSIFSMSVIVGFFPIIDPTTLQMKFPVTTIAYNPPIVILFPRFFAKHAYPDLLIICDANNRLTRGYPVTPTHYNLTRSTSTAMIAQKT